MRAGGWLKRDPEKRRWAKDRHGETKSMVGEGALPEVGGSVDGLKRLDALCWTARATDDLGDQLLRDPDAVPLTFDVRPAAMRRQDKHPDLTRSGPCLVGSCPPNPKTDPQVSPRAGPSIE